MSTPVCRGCGKDVICYDPNELAVCPDCCPKTTHPDGETGHVWVYSKWDRDDECKHCGILRRCTEESNDRD